MKAVCGQWNISCYDTWLVACSPTCSKVECHVWRRGKYGIIGQETRGPWLITIIYAWRVVPIVFCITCLIKQLIITEVSRTRVARSSTTGEDRIPVAWAATIHFPRGSRKLEGNLLENYFLCWVVVCIAPAKSSNRSIKPTLYYFYLVPTFCLF